MGVNQINPVGQKSSNKKSKLETFSELVGIGNQIAQAYGSVKGLTKGNPKELVNPVKAPEGSKYFLELKED